MAHVRERETIEIIFSAASSMFPSEFWLNIRNYFSFSCREIVLFGFYNHEAKVFLSIENLYI